MRNAFVPGGTDMGSHAETLSARRGHLFYREDHGSLRSPWLPKFPPKLIHYAQCLLSSGQSVG